MKNILVSACLLGNPCRFDGKRKPCEKVMSLAEKFGLISVCPECDGGLPTPRIPAERVGDRVINSAGCDVTEEYVKGAVHAYELCRKYGITSAVLKARSPSCGRDYIYDGTFTGTLTDRDGVCAEYLESKGIKIYTEEEIDTLLREEDADGKG